MKADAIADGLPPAVASFFHYREWEVVVGAPANFFLSGEHAVMVGEPALGQAIPLFVYTAIRRFRGSGVLVRSPGGVSFPDAADPENESKRVSTMREPWEWTPCQVERLLESYGYGGVEIGFYSQAPTRCGLATSGALGVSLSLGLHLIRPKSSDQVKPLLTKIADPNRKLSEVAQDETFETVFRLAWNLDALFHRDASSGANAFFALAGSPKGLPVVYLTEPRRGDCATHPQGVLPLRANGPQPCEHLRTERVKTGIRCPDAKDAGCKCPHWPSHYCQVYNVGKYRAYDLDEVSERARYDFMDLALRIVYSGRVKTTEAAIKHAEARLKELEEVAADDRLWWERPERTPRDIIYSALGDASRETILLLRKVLEDRDEQAKDRFLRSLNRVQAGLSFGLEVSTEQIRHLCLRAMLEGFGAKLTGGGTGGDVIVLAPADKENLLEKLCSEAEQQGKGYRVHWQGRWDHREMVCLPNLHDRTASFFRFLAYCDIEDSQGWRKRVLTEFQEDPVNEFTSVLDSWGRVPGRHLLHKGTGDDGAYAAFATAQEALKSLRELQSAVAVLRGQPILRAGVVRDEFNFLACETTEELDRLSLGAAKHLVTKLGDSARGTGGSLVVAHEVFADLPTDLQSSFKKGSDPIDGTECWIYI